MTPEPISRRNFSVRLASMLPAVVAVGPAGLHHVAERSGGEEVTHTSEAIHQEITLHATPQRVYTALMDPRQFGQVVQLSGAMAGTPAGTVPALISSVVGGEFSLFGGQIVGRHLELIPRQRIVQGWRAASWKPGAFSIARFDLTAQGSETLLTFTHTGFPDGAGKALAGGWTEHYWQPLAKFLAQ